MDAFSQISSSQEPPADPRLQPTPDYGSLGPHSDISVGGPKPTARGPAVRSALRAKVIAIAGGSMLAALAGAAGKSGHSPNITNLFSSANPPSVSSAKDFRQLDRMKPQMQAITLLQLAVANSDGARDQILARVNGWQGKLKWDPELAATFSAALNAKDLRVREAAIEVELATYGLPKNSSSVDYLVRAAESPNHARKIWALWTLGLLANRGFETNQVLEVLVSHLKDSDEDSRRWTVEGLALIGTTATVAPLLQTMHDDPSPSVRERAACSLAESGMLTREQRTAAVPQLLRYSDDPSLDAQTHAWAFHALSDITGQSLPNDSEAWRSWYENKR